ncbi:amidohydrolase [Brevibacterium album]|uniref:amidohydrolase n=1 Tax=Brevibacterium album TaxID=417948 RepID=UPI00041863E7|nr:amidohydrolase [Brevibacterium album]
MSTIAPALLADLEEGMEALEELYREFHRDPELSMQEHRTAARIAERLRGWGLEPLTVGGTGVVAVIENGPGPVLAYRADTDGLPITEDTGLPYASEATGTLPDGTLTRVMHGCGHDMHIAAGLEIARLLSAHRALWRGTVVMLFQPGEEIAAGARAMLDDGLWDRVPAPEAVYGQHVSPFPAGRIAVASGTAMSMADSLQVTLHGRQAHSSRPEEAIDPIVQGAFTIARLQTVVSREIRGSDMAVLTIGRFAGGLKENIIPDTAVFTVNIRTQDEKVRARVNECVRRIISAEAAASGAPEPTVEKLYEFPRCWNDPAETAALEALFRAELGEDRVVSSPPVAGSEDFGAFADSLGVPGVYWFTGSSSAERHAAGEAAGNHSPFFAPDDVPTTLGTAVRTGLTALLHRAGA